MWNNEDFESAIAMINVSVSREDVEGIMEAFRIDCQGEDRKKLWSMLSDLQREILKHPEYLPSDNEIENGAVA